MIQTGTKDAELVKHLLRRFGLGASEAEVDFYGADGYESAVQKLLSSDQHQEPAVLPDALMRDKNGGIIQNPLAAQVIWYSEQLITNRPLTYKMALFWHDHFATSAQKVASGPAMLQHLHVLRDGALGGFSDLLVAVSRDPAMLYWLDNQDNVAGKPNENFAREVMELFTLGEGHYTEKDVQEAARSFTGWTYGFRRGNRVLPARGQVPRPGSEYVMDIRSHDTGEKTVLGNRGEWEGEDVLGILAASPQTAVYLTTKIWEWFVYPNPEKSVIDRFAKKFRDSGLNVRSLIKEIMLSPEFKSPAARRSVIKNPYDFCVPMSRQLGLPRNMIQQLAGVPEDADAATARRAILPAVQLKQATASMGMELMYPPDVSGWPSGTAWISTSTMVERISWGQELFMGRNNAPNGYPAFDVFGSDAEQIASKMLSVFDAELPAEKRAKLADAARQAAPSINRRNAGVACAAAAKLLCSTPEFQFN